MNREYLFRGKPTERFADVSVFRKDLCPDGFCYGSLVVCNNRYYICSFAVCSHTTYYNNAISTMIEVIPETVGQFTGVPDKNGKKIFDGDILKAHYDKKYPEDETLTVVKWGEASGNGLGWLMCQKHCIPDSFGIPDGKRNEVVGNIYDNPELLKEVE